jgi:hypothetical protein
MALQPRRPLLKEEPKTPALPEVTRLDLPMVMGGFRSGWARALVNGKPMKIFTSRSAYMPWEEHFDELLAAFQAGKGIPDPPKRDWAALKLNN